MTGVLVHVLVLSYQDGDPLTFTFKLPEGSAAARLAERGASMLRLKASRTSAARSEALKMEKEFEEYEKNRLGKRKKGDPCQPEIPQLYEDSDAQGLLDEIDAWYLAMLNGSLPPLADGDKIGTFAHKAITFDDPITSAETGQRVLTVIYMTSS